MSTLRRIAKKDPHPPRPPLLEYDELWLNAQCAMLNAQCSMFNVQCSMFNAQYSMLNAQCSMFNVQCSMLNVQCSMFNAQCSMFNTQCSCSMRNAQCSTLFNAQYKLPPKQDWPLGTKVFKKRKNIQSDQVYVGVPFFGVFWGEKVCCGEEKRTKLDILLER